MSAVQPNAKVIGASLIVGAVVMYALFSTWHSSKSQLDELEAHFQLGHDHASHEHGGHEHGHHGHEHGHHDHHHGSEAKGITSWKTKPFEDIPATLLTQRDSIKVIDKHTEVTLNGQTLDIFSRQTSVDGKDKKFTILLLHGMRFSSQNWDDIKTIHLIAAMGYRVVAIDLPGFGNSKEAKLKEEDKAAFLKAFIKKENLGAPLIVSPSMSGSFSLPYLLGDSPETCHQRAAAYIPVAPVGTEGYSDADYKQCQIPVMIVYGEHDTKLGVSSLKNLKQFDFSEVFVIKNAGHACYLNDKDEWSRLVYNFINAIDAHLGSSAKNL